MFAVSYQEVSSRTSIDGGELVKVTKQRRMFYRKRAKPRRAEQLLPSGLAPSGSAQLLHEQRHARQAAALCSGKPLLIQELHPQQRRPVQPVAREGCLASHR